MIKNQLSLTALAIFAAAAFLFVGGVGMRLMRPNQVVVLEPVKEEVRLPEGSFRQRPEEYDAIGPPLIELRFSPLSLHLPDLRNYLVYYGRNERPDVLEDESDMHFSFSGSDEIASIAQGAPLYLVYDKDLSPVKYRFSPNNAESSLWIEATAQETEALVSVAMKNEHGEVIRQPEKYAKFTVKERPFTRFGARRWELGKWRVDGTILARQRARWYGKDLFLERHGGDEYRDLSEKYRVDFLGDEEPYSVYVKPGEALIWKDDRWQEHALGEETRDYPLLVLNKVDDRLMSWDLWEAGGKGRFSLNLLKSSELTSPPMIQNMFKFVGARTRSQLMFEVQQERLLISPQDWLLFTDGRWMKLETADEIDAYVERRLTGPLFVVDGVVTTEGRQTLRGVLFNASRTEMTEVELPLQQGAAPIAPTWRQDAVDEIEDEDVP